VIPHLHLVLGEGAAQSRFDPHHREKGRGHPDRRHLRGAPSLPDGASGALVEPYLLEGVDVLTPLEEVHGATGCPGGPGAGIAVEDRDETIWLLERERLQEHGVNDAEDRHVRADADGQGKEHRGAERLLLPEELQAESDVTKQRLHHTLIPGFEGRRVL
jgi:hypothetical protein